MSNPNSGAEFKEQILALLPSLRAFARSLCGDRTLADDLVQECLLRAWAARDRFEMGTNLKAWCYTILRNHCYDYFRKGRRETEDVDGALTARLSVKADQIDKLALQDLSRHLMELPDNQREALFLIGASGFSYEEAATICGCAVGTIKSRVNRARVQLSVLMGDEAGAGRPESSEAAMDQVPK